MTTSFVVPRIDVPIGRTSTGALVFFDGNFLRTFLQQLSDRIGGSVALSNTELAAAIQSAEAGAIVFQTAQADTLLPDVLQMGAPDASIPDVMQAADFAALGETTFQN